MRRAIELQQEKTSIWAHWLFMDGCVVGVIVLNMGVCLLLAAIWDMTIHVDLCALCCAPVVVVSA
jgi:hypothetical protein